MTTTKLRLCTYTSSSDISLELQPKTIELLTSQLETILEERLVDVSTAEEDTPAASATRSGFDLPNNDDRNEGEHDDKYEYGHFKYSAVEYVGRNDAHWLRTRPPLCCLQTILGIPEDFDRDKYDHKVAAGSTKAGTTTHPLDLCDPIVHLSVYHCFGHNNNMAENRGSTAYTSISGCCCALHAHPPKASWKRNPCHQAKRVIEECSGRICGKGKDENSIASNSKVVSVSWVDLRKARTAPAAVKVQENQDWLQIHSQAGALHFLRSLLGTSHGASPWASHWDTEDEKKQEKQEVRFPHDHDIVVVVIDFPIANRQVLDFRVSDAAPSWFLHAIVACEYLELDFNIGLNKPVAMRRHSEINSIGPPPATLLVYKRLSPRLFLTPLNPLVQSNLPVSRALPGQHDVPSLPDGCMWELVTIRKDGDAEEDNHKEYLYRPTVPPYLNLMQEYPSCVPLFEPQNLQTFAKEAYRISNWIPWPETQHYSSRLQPSTSDHSNGEVNHDASKPWTVVPLCHCFPANQIGNFQWIDMTKAQCPETCEILFQVLGPTLRTALFSQLAPNTTLEPHTGWSDLANHVFRLHIPLVVPGSDDDGGLGLCGTWVDGCVESHIVGRPLLFDDSKLHRAFNYSDQPRIVLIVDLERPAWLPVGYATGGHSEELDQFIRQMEVVS